MDTSKFDARIKELKKQTNDIQEQMENTRKEFLEAAKEFVPAWFQSCVERAVVSHPERAKEYDLNGLRNIKADLQKLIAQAPSIVEEALSSDEYWPHRGEMPGKTDPWHGRYQDYWRRSTTEGLKGSIKNTFRHVGAILAKYHLSNDSWLMPSPREGPKYVKEYDWSQKMDTLLKRYLDLGDDLIKFNEELKKMEREKAEAEAKDLWEQT